MLQQYTELVIWGDYLCWAIEGCRKKGYSGFRNKDKMGKGNFSR